MNQIINSDYVQKKYTDLDELKEKTEEDLPIRNEFLHQFATLYEKWWGWETYEDYNPYYFPFFPEHLLVSLLKVKKGDLILTVDLKRYAKYIADNDKGGVYYAGILRERYAAISNYTLNYMKHSTT